VPSARKAAGLVVDEGKRAVGQAVDTVGLGGEHELAGRPRERYSSAHLRGERRDRAAPLALGDDEPARDVAETRPPARPDPGVAVRQRAAAAPAAASIPRGPADRGAWPRPDSWRPLRSTRTAGRRH